MSVKVLILEDDKNLGDSLKQLLSTQHTAEVQVTHVAEEAEHLMSFEAYDLLIVDLVLPKINGLDFLKRIIQKNYLHPECVIWCISGILDKNIIPREINKYVNKFFKKSSFNTEQINKEFCGAFHTVKYKKYFKFFYMESQHNIPYKEWLEHCKTIEPHHLMFVYLHLCNNGFTGILELTTSTGMTSKIFFKNGNIFYLKMDSMQIGQLLVKNKLISDKDIQIALEKKGSTPLGKYLVSQCLISPHTIQSVLQKQLIFNLSKTMQGSLVHLHYFDKDITKEQIDEVSIGLNHLMPLLDDWIYSKVQTSWIRDFLKTHQDRVLFYLGNRSIPYKQGRSKLFESVFMNPIKDEIPVRNLIHNDSFKNDRYIKEIYYRLLIKNCYLSLPSTTATHIKVSRDQSILADKLKNFIKKSKYKNYFELLGVSEQSTKEKLKNKYLQFIKICHPDYRSVYHSKELQELYNKSLTIVNQAYKTLMDPEKRQNYIEKLSNLEKDRLSKIHKEYEQAKQNLKTGHYEKSFNQFNKIIKSSKAPKDTFLFWMWTDLKRNKAPLSKEQQKTFIDYFDDAPMELQQAPFFFVKGLFMKRIDKIMEAKSCFNKALLINPKMIEARQERYSLQIIPQKKHKAKRNKLFGFFNRSA